MRVSYFFLTFLFSISAVYGQYSLIKPPLNVDAINNWVTLGSPQISSDGNYVMYLINNKPVNNTTLVIQSITNENWIKYFYGVSEGVFLADRRVAFKRGDSLFFVTLGSDQVSNITNVSSLKCANSEGCKWICFRQKNNTKDLYLIDILNGKDQVFRNVEEYSFNKTNKGLVLNTVSYQDSTPVYILQWVTLETGLIDTIWNSLSDSIKDCNIGEFCFDDAGEQLAFYLEQGKGDKKNISIWYYKKGMAKAINKANSNSPGIDSGLTIENGDMQFSKNGYWINFKLQRIKQDLIPKPNMVKLDIWHYNDVVLQSQQLSELLSNKGKIEFSATINVNDKKVIQLEYNDEEIGFMRSNGDFVIVNKRNKVEPVMQEFYGERESYLLSLHDHSKKLLYKGLNHTFSFSPGGKYLVYFDSKQKNIFSYNLKTGLVQNITKLIPFPICHDNDDGGYMEIGIGAWLEKDEALLVYDEYDIWKVSPENGWPPICLTKKYGRMHHIKFGIVNGADLFSNNPVVFSKFDVLLLTAFDVVNKYNGFYRLDLSKFAGPELLSMGPYNMYRSQNQKPFYTELELARSMRPIKAKDTDTWILQRMTATDAPNYYLTKDFKKFNELTNIQPQKEYNWLTTELLTWKQLDGTLGQGILFKPENFDPHKKYPIIFYYYEKLSHCLYDYPRPDVSKGPINVPWFVSHGYLVFIPDIHYSIGTSIAKAVCNSVISAAKYLSTMTYVNSKKMGVQGHSFGGHETLDLITNTGLFSAAVEAAGVSDVISSYGSIGPNGYGNSRQNITEVGQSRLGNTLWKRPDLYVECSAIFKASKVTTPLLIMHNKADQAVPWGQGVEFYLALRRLGKKVWLLQYDDAGHSLIGDAAIDYNKRLTQFFDYYLKDQTPAIWITRGVPAKMKGIDDGLELDYDFKTNKSFK